jgi:hypothetical protein
MAAMRASFFMFFDYLMMIGGPVLLVLLALSSILFPGAGSGTAIRTVILVLLAAGALAYGAIGIREVFAHRRRES